jgi:hypothetical protein
MCIFSVPPNSYGSNLTCFYSVKDSGKIKLENLMQRMQMDAKITVFHPDNYVMYHTIPCLRRSVPYRTQAIKAKYGDN